ncbi:MAG: hypothetical protein IJ587_05155 [Synergistaceae bacterium]|nr:hypothetical protein [Synergistaceae bacterium]
MFVHGGKIDTDARMDTILTAFDGLNNALWEKEDVVGLNGLAGFLERELGVAKRSLALLTGVGL